MSCFLHTLQANLHHVVRIYNTIYFLLVHASGLKLKIGHIEASNKHEASIRTIINQWLSFHYVLMLTDSEVCPSLINTKTIPGSIDHSKDV